MKQNTFVWLLIVEAAICVILAFMQASLTGVFSSAMAFPFEQIGFGLRTLSLSSELGNLVAIVCYMAVCLLPVVALFCLGKRRKLNTEDFLLGLLSAVLFVVIYLMINPSLLEMFTHDGAASIAKAILGSMVYSVLCGYFVLRVLRIFSASNMEQLERYMTVMLSLLNVIFVFLIFGSCVGKLLDSIGTLRAGNSGHELELGISYAFLFLQFVVNALPYALDLFIVFAAKRLLHEMQTDRYSSQSVSSAERLARLCSVALTVTVLSNVAFNLLQLVFANSLRVLNSSVQIPVLSIIFVLAVLLLTRFVEENKLLKDENDQYI